MMVQVNTPVRMVLYTPTVADLAREEEERLDSILSFDPDFDASWSAWCSSWLL